MSFLDPFFDAFSDLGDSIGDFAESDAGKLAMLAAAAYLTGGASLGAGAGTGVAGAGTAGVAGAGTAGTTLGAIEAVEASQMAGLTGSQLGGQIASGGIMGATPVISQTPLVGEALGSLPPSPTNLQALQVQAMGGSAAAPAGAVPPATPLPPAGDPTLTARGIANTAAQDTAAQNAAREQIANNAVRTTLPTTSVTGAPPVDYSAGANYNLAPQQAGNAVSSGGAPGIKAAGLPPTQGGFANGVDAFSRFIDTNPKTALAYSYLGAKGLGLLDQKEPDQPEKYNGVLTRYKMSPDFQASNAQPNVYKPTYAAAGGVMQAGGPVEQMSMNAIGGNQGYPQSGLPHSMGYASPTASPIPQNVLYGDAGDTGVNPRTGQEAFAQGGIAHFRRGDLADSLDFYKSLTGSRGGKSYSGKSDPGASYAADIYYDMDPDTRYQDPLTAAQIRQAKVNKRANVEPPAAKRPTPMGQLNLRPPGVQAAAASGSSLDPENAAQGGIMHSSLGGYAAGGNPRLLKGPGDGMSDNIPATIAGKQPARLADGEFVIPADVVSHLGNGSTEAGAKRLHEMMNKIRKARTGNPKQGKQINPNKFMPA